MDRLDVQSSANESDSSSGQQPTFLSLFIFPRAFAHLIPFSDAELEHTLAQRRVSSLLMMVLESYFALRICKGGGQHRPTYYTTSSVAR